ncbi:MAG: Holliday junction branch migration protein RuvA [Candidatus Riflebacteria bacterium]|nr:Holliday junction branch migration protein RuvA [Candidatus Riflebacteria bacterium]
MIAVVQGPIVERTDSTVVIEAGGVGYEVVVPTSVLARIGDGGGPVRLRTHLDVKEDGWTLYGFLDRDELQIFRHLISVSGVGPRTAVGILSAMTPEQILEALRREDLTAFSRIRGIGKKTAAKVVFELRDKVQAMPAGAPLPGGPRGGAWSEAAEALRSLGYKETEVADALSWAGKALTGPEAEDVALVLRKALAYFQQPAAR